MTKNPYKAYQKQDQGGYQNIPQPGNPAYTEAWALIEAARRMAESLQGGPLDDLKHRSKVRDALRLNWRLWTIFQSELTMGERVDSMPEELRLNILSLCKFVDSHTIQVMSNVTPEGVVTLIDINRNIASGLLEQFTQGEEAAAESGENEAASQASGSEGEESAPAPSLSLDEKI